MRNWFGAVDGCRDTRLLLLRFTTSVLRPHGDGIERAIHPLASYDGLRAVKNRKVYTLLGKLESSMKRSEDVMSAYHRDADEGAREARALLASAAANPQSHRVLAVPRVPNVQRLVGGRKGCVPHVNS